MSNNSYTNIFTGNPVWASTVSYVQYVISGNLSLNWPTQFLDNPNTVGGWTSISTVENGFFITLPDATLASTGQSIVFINDSSGNFSFTITNNASNNLITLSRGQAVCLLLTDTTTSAGEWLVFPFAQGMTAVTSVGATTTSGGLTITGSPITSIGNIDFELASSLNALSALNSTGIMVQSATGPSTMKTVSLVGGINIDVADADGISANPTINLSDTLAGVVSAQIGSLTIVNNTIETTSGNTDIQLLPNGTGNILLGSGLNPPTVSSTGNISNVNISSATQGAFSIVTTPTIYAATHNGNVAGSSSITLQSPSANPFIITSTGITIHPSVTRAAVAFTGSTAVATASYNVTSVVRNSVGNYTINIPNGILGGFLGVFVSAVSSDGGTTLYVGNVLSSSTFTAVNIVVRNLSNALADPVTVYFSC